MTTPATVADKPELYCWKCSARHTYTRMLASRPVYSCDGCGALREILELGKPGFTSRMPEPAPHPAPTRITPISRITKETKPMPNPLQTAIAAAVKDALEPIQAEIKEFKKEIRADFDKLAEKVGDGVSPKELEEKCTALFERETPKLVSQALMQMLAAAPKTRRGVGAAATEDSECKHKNFMRKCASCQKRHATKDEGDDD